jgi:hypothetical protein
MCRMRIFIGMTVLLGISLLVAVGTSNASRVLVSRGDTLGEGTRAVMLAVAAPRSSSWELDPTVIAALISLVSALVVAIIAATIAIYQTKRIRQQQQEQLRVQYQQQQEQLRVQYQQQQEILKLQQPTGCATR